MPNPETHTIKRLGGLGILSEEDLTDLGAGCRRVYDLMQDGEWHSDVEIRVNHRQLKQAACPCHSPTRIRARDVRHVD